MILKRVFVMFLMLNMLWVTFIVDAQACDEFETATDFAESARVLLDEGFIADAIEAFTCAIELAPDDLDILNERGLVYYETEQYDDAFADFEQILARDDSLYYAWNNRANIYHYRGEIDLALADYTKSIDLYDLDPIPYANRANVYYQQGEYFLAESDLYRALDIDPTYKSAYLSLAWVYTGMNVGNEEHGMFAEWIRLNTTDTEERTLSGSIESEVFDMAEGLLYRLTFTGIAGQTIRISARANSSQDVDPLLVLLDDSGLPIASDDDSGVNLDAVISGFVLPSDGDYTLLLSYADFGSTGEITLSVDLGEAGGIDITNSFATFNLFVDELATVFTTAGDRLNVRSGPGLEFEILTKLDAGTLVTLIEGPKKVDGYAWWRIRDDAGNEGWAVERVDEEQTLQLALLVGEDAIVTTGGDKLNVRTGAGSNNDLAFQLDDGARVTLLDTPEVVGGFQWWHIRTEDGQEGWTIDRFDGDRMLIPAKEIKQ